MSETTNIGWTDHTGGPWLGCSKVSAGCANCYAWLLMLMRLFPIMRKAYKAAGFADWETRPVWGDKATRVLSKGFWSDARRINAAHAEAGTRGKWFPSMIDWLDEMPAGIIDQDGTPLNAVEVRARLLKLICDTPELDWLLLTKRIENSESMVNESIGIIDAGIKLWTRGGLVPHNVWIGVSVENQEQGDKRIPLLLQIPAKVRFLSVEPLLEPVRINKASWLYDEADQEPTGKFRTDPITGKRQLQVRVPKTAKPLLHWVIIGGESGANRRDCGVEAIIDVAEQCVAAGVPCFVKQDSAFKPGQQGRIPDHIWKLKQFPNQ